MKSVSNGFWRWMVAALLVVAAVVVHGRVSVLRSRTLLEHDEAITLMAAAGKSHLWQGLYAPSESPRVASAGELQQFMQCTGTTGFWDVLRSLAGYDIHPPFYFLVVQGAQRLGIRSQAVLRMFGLFVMIAAAWVGHRYVWPNASPFAKGVAAAWLLLSPTCIELATQLRQYPLVYLGTMMSLAGLVRLSNVPRHRVTSSAVLVGSGPLVLLASHFGSAVWIVMLVGCGVWLARIGPVHTRAVFVRAVLGSLLITSPLLYWWWKYAGEIGAAPPIPPSRWWTDILGPLFDGVGHAWASWPNRFDPSGPGPMIGLLVAFILVAAALRSSPFERLLAVAVMVWLLTWSALVAAGKMPPHAVMPKYAAPLMLGLLTIVARSTAPTRGLRIRYAATALLVVMIASHTLGVRQALARPTTQPLMTALARCECLLINVPKRGYVLPLVAPMLPSARVIVATPDRALRDWSAMETLLPTNDVMVVDVMQEQTAESRELAERLKRKYEHADRLREEPARVMTWYRRPSAPWKMR